MKNLLCAARWRWKGEAVTAVAASTGRWLLGITEGQYSEPVRRELLWRVEKAAISFVGTRHLHRVV